MVLTSFIPSRQCLGQALQPCFGSCRACTTAPLTPSITSLPCGCDANSNFQATHHRALLALSGSKYAARHVLYGTSSAATWGLSAENSQTSHSSSCNLPLSGTNIGALS